MEAEVGVLGGVEAKFVGGALVDGGAARCEGGGVKGSEAGDVGAEPVGGAGEGEVAGAGVEAGLEGVDVAGDEGGAGEPVGFEGPKASSFADLP